MGLNHEGESGMNEKDKSVIDDSLVHKDTIAFWRTSSFRDIF